MVTLIKCAQPETIRKEFAQGRPDPYQLEIRLHSAEACYLLTTLSLHQYYPDEHIVRKMFLDSRGSTTCS